MSDENLKKYMIKVAALRALAAKAGTRAEAEAALRQAAEIIQKYRLEEADISMGADEDPALQEQPLAEFKGRWIVWQKSLAAGLARIFGCFAWWRSGFKNTIPIVGRRADVEMVRYLFAWATAEIVRLSQKETGKAARNAFCRGAADGFVYALRQGQNKAEALHSETAPGSSAAMVLVRRSDQAEAIANRRFKIRSVKLPDVSDAGAYARGARAGKNMNATPATLSGSSPRMLVSHG